jgi:uncharacterized protein (DUF58 family)
MARGAPAVFPLVPRRRVEGAPFGERPSLRRGRGTDVAGSRPYVPGDPVATIDWYASARLSSARASEEFLVRERYADEAPHVLVVWDRRPSMALYGPEFPWLSKPRAAEAALRAIAASARAARAELGYLDLAGGGAFWRAPGRRGEYRVVEERASGASFDAPPDATERALRFLLGRRAALPAGSFVFVLSDFLPEPPRELWRRLRALRWDVVPVVIQDPLWEQSFPLLPGVVVPVVDPATGRVEEVRLGRRESEQLRARNERRLEELLALLRRVGHDPVLLGSDDQREVVSAFLGWSARRRRAPRVR